MSRIDYSKWDHLEVSDEEDENQPDVALNVNLHKRPETNQGGEEAGGAKMKDGDPPEKGGHSGASLLDKRLQHLHTQQKDTSEQERRDMERNEILESVKQKLKAHLREKFTCVQDGTSASQSQLEHVYTRLYVTRYAGVYGSAPHEILDQFKLPDVESQFSLVEYQQIDCLNIFKPAGTILKQQQHAKDGPIQRVMTKGIAGIGKTFAVQNFSLNWAEGKSNQHIDLIFMLPFRELNMLKEGEYSLLQLLLHFYPELKLLEDTQQLLNKQVLFILDGLDECRFPLDFEGAMRVSETVQRATVDVLLTNLIKGNLLPNALIWLTSRPAAACQIPVKYIDQMTEVQGFTEQQKEEYFRKRFSSASQAKEVLSCLRGMISFYFMGHIPIFCWITAEVLKEGWCDQRSRRIATMTELYIYYLLIQTQRTAQKYVEESSNKTGQEQKSESENGTMLLNLSKLAFEQLQKGNIIFYEEDLQECGIDVDKASVFCGFCSEILKQERGLYQKKMFSFVHLSFQEFLAALHMFHSCVTKTNSTLKSFLGVDTTDLGLLELQMRVVDKALHSEKGQWDLFLCFFLGFSLESNQKMLQGLLPQIKSSSNTVEEMKTYLKAFHAGNIPQERCVNLFLCKFELNEKRFQDDIKMYLHSGPRLSTIDCVVLSTMLQISGEIVDELDLTQCVNPIVGIEKLLLQMKNSKRALLKSYDLIDDRLQILLSILQSADSCLRELCLVCLSNVSESPPDALLTVLESPDCKLETLRLSGYTLDYKRCHKLARILQSKRSSLRALDLTECVYGYARDDSGHCTKELGETVKYDDVNNELSLPTVIPAALIGSACKLEEFSMLGCHLKSKCCQVFSSVLCSDFQLKELDLSRNDLQDLGVQLLSVGLGSPKCRLEVLRLSCCGITEDGCAFLASALRSNPSHLRELDLSFNHPGVSGVRLLSERLKDPECRMEKLNVDHNEEHWVNPQLLNKYACDLTFDPNTVNEHLLLSECNRKVDFTEEKQPYPDHPERFDAVPQVLCQEGLTGRCYWEVEWNGYMEAGVAYKSLKRKGHWDAEIALSSEAWIFGEPSLDGYSFRHSLRETFIPVPINDVHAYLHRLRRVGFFLDWPAGILSFYSLSGDRKTLLHTFHTTFTEPLYPVFSIIGGSLTLSSAVDLRMDSVSISDCLVAPYYELISLEKQLISFCASGFQAQSRFTPEVITERIGISYRFTFPSSGVFQCSLTGLVFNVTHEGEVTYKTLIWDEMLLRPAYKVPGGPLFSIQCPQGSICQLHLPHCEPEPALVSQSLSVVHITDDGMSIIQPREISETHVVVDTPHLSNFGIVWDLIERFKNLMTKPVRGQILLFKRPAYRRNKLIVSVILLPSNVPLHEVKVQYDNCEYIQAPSFCLLHKGQEYSLCSDPEGFRIQPSHSEFFENYGPNYHASFEVTVMANTEEVTLMVRDPDRTCWEHSLHPSASRSHASPDENQPRMTDNTPTVEKLQRARSEFADRVSDPVLNKLLDELLIKKVLSDAECESVRAKLRGDKARDVIDMVRKKGAEASSIMISILSASDPFLCRELRLT